MTLHEWGKHRFGAHQANGPGETGCIGLHRQPYVFAGSGFGLVIETIDFALD